ncbi:Protein FAM13A [Nymphon striatum]|nr:Protein FAM13A [Nymphon striatum]
MQQLKKKIQCKSWFLNFIVMKCDEKENVTKETDLKKRIRSFENKFEEERGYKPSHAEKMNHNEVKLHLDKLIQAKKELKELQQESMAPSVMPPPSPDSLEKYSTKKLLEENVTPPLSPPSSHTGAIETPTSHHTVSETLSHIKRFLDEQRINNRRPEAVESMTPQQVLSEKIALQKSLLHFEKIHGRPEHNNQRDSMRPLYDRYRHVKKMIARCLSPNTSRSDANINSDLAPIIEDKTMNFISPSREMAVDDIQVCQSSKPTKIKAFQDEKHPLHSSKSSDSKKNSCNLHELSYFDLIKQFELTKAYKQQLRGRISNFEDNFFKENGRKVLKADRGVMNPVYQQYKEIKAKLKLMDALITKYENVGGR